MVDLIKCPYCGAEQKKLTPIHLKKHNISYIDYLKEYDKDRYYLKIVTDFIWDFYKPCTSKYIEQVYSKDSREYCWMTKYAMSSKYLEELKEIAEKEAIESNELMRLNSTRPFPFGKSDIMKHLKKETTVGIYTTDGNSSFLTFDIDEDNLDYVESIYNSLCHCGIQDNQILLSYSGNKGYHISIFFDKSMQKAVLRKLYDLILWESNLLDVKRKNGTDVIEARGITNQAVKLPLSINRKNKLEYRKIKCWQDIEYRYKTGKGNFCYLISQYGGEIDTIKKVTSMQKIASNKIKDIINNLNEEVQFYNSIPGNEIRQVGEIVNEIDLRGFYNNERDIENSIENLLSKPIMSGERNKTLLKIAIYNKSLNMTAAENQKYLIEFTTNKKIKHEFGTSIDENIREIKAMIETIYNSNTAYKYKISTDIKDISFTRNEILEILTVKSKPLRKLYFVMFTHFKLYGNKSNNQFYMTYERIRHLLHIDGTIINKELLELEKQNKIFFIRKGEKDNESLESRNLPNIYMLNYKIQSNEKDMTYKLLCTERSSSDDVAYVNFEMMCAKVLKIIEIKEYFGDASKVLKYKYQKLYEML